MLYILNYDELIQDHPNLAHSMFVDRADQFSRRLKWNVDVNGRGEERDQYDTAGTEYVILADEADRHVGSMRFRPTTLHTMAEEHFADLWCEPIIDDRTLECTRFVTNRYVTAPIAELIFASHTYCLIRNVKTVIGVYEVGMERVYEKLGWKPQRTRLRGSGRKAVCGGKWAVNLMTYESLRSRISLSQDNLDDILRACDPVARERSSRTKYMSQVSFRDAA